MVSRHTLISFWHGRFLETSICQSRCIHWGRRAAPHPAKSLTVAWPAKCIAVPCTLCCSLSGARPGRAAPCRAAVPAAPCRAVPHRAGRGGADPRTIYLFFPVYLSLSPMLCFLSHQWWRTDLCARTPRPCLCRDTPMLSHADPRRARAPGHAAGDKRRRLPAA